MALPMGLLRKEGWGGDGQGSRMRIKKRGLARYELSKEKTIIWTEINRKEGGTQFLHKGSRSEQLGRRREGKTNASLIREKRAFRR